MDRGTTSRGNNRGGRGRGSGKGRQGGGGARPYGPPPLLFATTAASGTATGTGGIPAPPLPPGAHLDPEDVAESRNMAMRNKARGLARAQKREEDDESDAHNFLTMFRKTPNEKLTAPDDDDDDDGNLDDDEKEEDYDGNFEVSPEEEAALEAFMPLDGDMSFSEGEDDDSRGADTSDVVRHQMAANVKALVQKPAIDAKVKRVYQSVGHLLKSYTIGKLPKAFKLLPVLTNWEELVFLTNPDEWSPQALHAAVRLFVSGLNQRASQRFMNVVLLPCIREAIQTNKKLHFHQYLALKRALYKPAAFYKGFLLPLCENGSCTLREAVIVGSALAKVSIPMLHSAAAILKLAQIPLARYHPTTSVFMRILLDKKYSLPYRVIDEVVNHFVRFVGDSRRMIVLWHQCLLVFVERYKADLTTTQKDQLRALMRVHTHTQVTPEINTHLDHSACRGEQRLDPATEELLSKQFIITTTTTLPSTTLTNKS
ncbi:snoRNA-binding rRNA-processing protein [Pelomyxa schiedti]|nr:snoRNA-binding rRNA-processing protein [Pelomyxa schiedti]